MSPSEKAEMPPAIQKLNDELERLLYA